MTTFKPLSPPSADTPELTYELRLMTTRSATGYFMPVPKAAPDFKATLAYLREHPNDEFMHRWGLQQVLQMPPDPGKSFAAGRGPGSRLGGLAAGGHPHPRTAGALAKAGAGGANDTPCGPPLPS